MKTLRENGSAASYSTSAGSERTGERRAQLEQGAQARVLLRQLLGARGALGLRAPAAPARSRSAACACCRPRR